MAVQQVYVVLNTSTNKLELSSFGIVLPVGDSVELVQYDTAITSISLQDHLANGDLTRLINGVSIGYPDANRSTMDLYETNILLDTSIGGGLYVDQSLNVYGDNLHLFAGALRNQLSRNQTK